MALNRQELHQKINRSRSLQERLNDGSNANLSLVSEQWLQKADKVGLLPQIEHEFQIYQQLDAVGLMGTITPVCDLDFGIYEYPAAIYLSLIGQGASLWEYALAHLSGEMSTADWQSLCRATGEKISKFHAGGFVHIDLHAGNIVIELEENEWQPFLIDFGLSTCETIEYPFLVVERRVFDAETDLEKLLESLSGLVQELPDSFSLGLRDLEDAACPHY
jgi:tRNA A-37 threonylcarbamoyl transferase component Bud32